MAFSLQEESQKLQQDLSQYEVPNDHNVQSMDQASIADLLDSEFTNHCVPKNVNDFIRCH